MGQDVCAPTDMNQLQLEISSNQTKSACSHVHIDEVTHNLGIYPDLIQYLHHVHLCYYKLILFI